MARVTVEDCLARVPNRFALTILASRRARALGEGRGVALVECDNKEGVTALREVSGDKVRFREDVEEAMRDFIKEARRQLRVTTGEHTFLEAASLRALEEEDADIEEDAPAVEELPTDPEQLGKKATAAAAEVEEGEKEEEPAEIEAAAAEGFDDEALDGAAEADADSTDDDAEGDAAPEAGA